jgi:hypothetical protein
MSTAKYLNRKYKEDHLVNIVKSHKSNQPNMNSTFLGFVVLCIFKYSNKNIQPDATINRKIYCLVA